MNKKFIYNLEFPGYCDRLELCGHIFVPVDDYEKRVKRLSHHISSIYDIEIVPNTGKHEITATVSIPGNMPISPLRWGTKMPLVEDILLILALFTGRDIFAADTENDPRPIVRDSRPYLCYETLGASIHPEIIHHSNGRFEEVGFQKEIQKILDLIYSPDWLTKFEGGHVLMIARQMYLFQILEKAFLMANVLFEHVYYMENIKTKTEAKIRGTPGKEKLCFILEKYGFIYKSDEAFISAIDKFISYARNQIAHYGIFKSETKQPYDAKKFVELASRLLAKILGIQHPTDAFNTREWLVELAGRSYERTRSAGKT